MDTDKYLLKDVDVTGAGNETQVLTAQKTLQLIGSTDSGSGSATVIVQVTNDPARLVWLTTGTLELALTTTPSTQGFALDSKWDYVRGNVTAISGTGARVSLIMST